MTLPSYPEVGASVTWPLPGGYDHLHERRRLGAPDAFDDARLALFSWAPQRAAGITVTPAGVAPEPGTTVLLGFGAGPLRITAPCRVVWRVDGPDRAGFAYGTLPGHPERGEEAFVLDRTAAGTWFPVSAFSRPPGTRGSARRSPGSCSGASSAPTSPR